MSTETRREELRFPKGTVIFRQGDPGEEMFVVAAGHIRLTIGKGGHETEVNTLGPGEFFGELSLLSGEPRSATATATEDATLLAIGRDVYAMMVQDDLDIVFRMLNIQGQRLSRTNVPLEDLAARLGRVRIVGHCLRRLWQTGSGLPIAIDIDALGSGFAGSPEAVEGTVRDMVQRGIGQLQGRTWTIAERDHIDEMLEALTAYAEE
jgi:CRP-like cAMP-binding protein